MMKRAWHVGRLLGIPLEVDFSWLVFFALATWQWATMFAHQPPFPLEPAWSWGMAALLVVLLFLCILLHELAHSWVAIRNHVAVERISLFIFGGVAQLSHEPNSPSTELKMAVAGPAASLVLAGIAYVTAWSISLFPFIAPGKEVFEYLAQVNLLLAGFNMLPGFPLDGGRIVRACLWVVFRSFVQATRIASVLGQVVGLGLILLAGWAGLQGSIVSGLWLALIGLFVARAAKTSFEHLVAHQMFDGFVVGNVMDTAPVVVSPELSIHDLVRQYFFARPHLCYPVADRQELKGVVTLKAVHRVPRDHWLTVSVADIVQPLSHNDWVSPHDALFELLERFSRYNHDRWLVVEDGMLVGQLDRRALANLAQIWMTLGPRC